MQYKAPKHKHTHTHTLINSIRLVKPIYRSWRNKCA